MTAAKGTAEVAATTSPMLLEDAKLTTWGELQNRTFPQRHFIIYPILSERQVGMIFAPSGVGKTWFTLSLAVAAASGQDAGFLGFQGSGQGVKVLVIDGEMDAQDLKTRLNLIVKAVGADPQRVRDNLILLSRQDQDFTTKFPDIAKKGSQKKILSYCRDNEIKLLILDNLSTLAPSVEDENSSAKMNSVNMMMLKAKQAEVSCLLVHHTNKNGDNYRGSQTLSVTLDLMISLKRPDNYLINSGETAFVLEWPKVRSQLPKQITQAKTIVFKTTDGVSSWYEDEHPATFGQEIKQRLETCRYATQQELAAEVGVSPGHMSKKIKQAITMGVFSNKDLQNWLKKAQEWRAAAKTTEEEAMAELQSTIDEGIERVTDSSPEVAPAVQDEKLADPTMF